MLWNENEFNKLLEEIKARGVLWDGTNVSTKEEIYEKLGDKLGVSSYTVKNWAVSKKPDPSMIAKIERIMQLPVGKLTVGSISDSDKRGIQKCCEEIEKHLERRAMEDKAASFRKMCNEVEKQSRYMRDDLYQKVKDFIEKEIKPLEEAEEFAEPEPYTKEFWEDMDKMQKKFDDWMEKEISPLFK